MKFKLNCNEILFADSRVLLCLNVQVCCVPTLLFVNKRIIAEFTGFANIHCCISIFWKLFKPEPTRIIVELDLIEIDVDIFTIYI